MKLNYTPFIFFLHFVLLNHELAAQKKLRVETPVLIDSSTYLYQAGDFYLGGQPSKEILEKLSADGVKVVINLRTLREVEDFMESDFNEESFAKDLHMDYLLIPMGGDTGYTHEMIHEMAGKIKSTDGKVYIHCRSAGRATLAWMAWLIRYRGYTIDEAVQLGKKASFGFPLQDLLGYPLTISKKK